jgi:hypothetical protein
MSSSKPSPLSWLPWHAQFRVQEPCQTLSPYIPVLTKSIIIQFERGRYALRKRPTFLHIKPILLSNTVLSVPPNDLVFPDYMDSDRASHCTGSSHSYYGPVVDDALEYITLYLANDDPINTAFVSSSGKRLYQVSSVGGSSSSSKTPDPGNQRPHITRVSRLYGRAAMKATLSDDGFAHGLTLAEMEWLKRTKASRIRFCSGSVPSKQYTVDLRVDEFLKSTKSRYVLSLQVLSIT